MTNALLKAVMNVAPKASELSALPRFTNAASNTYAHTYTIVMTTPRSATPTFLHTVQQSDLEPVFMGQDGIFFRKERLSDWGWSNIFVLPGEGDAAQLPSSCNLRQKWSFSIGTDSAFVVEDGALSTERFEDGTPFVATQPQDLVDVTKHWLSIRRNRLFVMAFLNLGGDESGKVDEYKTVLQEAKEGFEGMKVHVFGDVRVVDNVSGSTQSTSAVADEANALSHFALLSFASEKEYGEFLVSDVHGRLVGSGSEGMVLTKELRLPPRESAIDRYGWEYGNPYEPYGEDWFG